ncbi:hypothetical protein L3X38_000705 [Prunus dulcis]|uniref:Uncharacterized protein n=1 Tax=Prunus dulcis TaxID=3755 RepID=A0AAD4WR83_PRUDU|nr:hypothetical protein L3X38_000705 [Prunus dulcis]
MEYIDIAGNYSVHPVSLAIARRQLVNVIALPSPSLPPASQLTGQAPAAGISTTRAELATGQDLDHPSL